MALLFLTALSIVVLLLLAIAGFNVANLLFAQAINRQREMAVRLAVGATRGRLLRLVLLESLLLSLGGGALGVLLSLWSTGALSSFRLPAPIPLNVQVSVDGRTLAYTFLISVLCGLLLGIAPAWAASRPRVANSLKAEAGFAATAGRFSAGNLLVVAQVAMAVAAQKQARQCKLGRAACSRSPWIRPQRLLAIEGSAHFWGNYANAQRHYQGWTP